MIYDIGNDDARLRDLVGPPTADLIILDAPSESHLAYRPGTNLAWRVVKDGVAGS